MDKRAHIIREKLESTLFFEVTIKPTNYFTHLVVQSTNKLTDREYYLIELEGNIITVYDYNNTTRGIENMRLTTRTSEAINYILSKERKTILKNVKNLLKKVDKLD
ncbi:hypothetical protein [Bacillus phage Sarmo]|nr:hypothetical protein [Bacillus phage Sarmo]